MSNIQAGVISDLIKKLPDGLKSAIDGIFDSFSDIDGPETIEIKNSQESPDGTGVMFDIETSGGKTIRTKIVPSEGYKNFFDIYLLTRDGKKKKISHVSEEKIDKAIIEFLNKTYENSFKLKKDSKEDDFDETEVFSNKKIHISLSKIEGSDEIQITSIYSNYDPMSVYDDVSNLLDEPEFTSSVGYEPTSYEIIPSEDSYEVNEINSLGNSFYTLNEILAACYALSIRLDSLYAEAKITNSQDLNSILNYKGLVQNEIQSILDLADHQSINFECISNMMSFLLTSYMGSTLNELINQHAAILELYKVNLDESVQTMIDEWINSLTYSNFM